MLLFYNLTQLFQSAVILQGVNHDNSCRSCACLQKKKALLTQGFSWYEYVNIIISHYTTRS